MGGRGWGGRGWEVIHKERKTRVTVSDQNKTSGLPVLKVVVMSLRRVIIEEWRTLLR